MLAKDVPRVRCDANQLPVYHEHQLRGRAHDDRDLHSSFDAIADIAQDGKWSRAHSSAFGAAQIFDTTAASLVVARR